MFILDEGKVSYQKNTVFFLTCAQQCKFINDQQQGATRIFERGENFVEKFDLEFHQKTSRLFPQ